MLFVFGIEVNMENSKYQKKEFNKEMSEFENMLCYDFQNLKLSILAQKIKSQAIVRPKAKLLYY